MKRFRHILIGVDLTPEGEVAAGCRDALSQGVWLARQQDAAVTLVHVVDSPADVQAVTSLQPQAHLTHRTEWLEAVLAELALQLPARHVTTKVLVGSHWRALVAEARALRHDLVVVGTRGRGLLGRAIFGSTARELLRHCPCPVWVVKPRERKTCSAVLVAHDLSSVGEEALIVGAEMARLYDARLHVLHVQEQPEGSEQTPEKLQHGAEALEWLDRRCRELATGDKSSVVAVLAGTPHTAILDYINRESIDLVVMGTVARRGLAGFIPGNTAEMVLRWIGCSLVAVKPKDFGIAGDTDAETGSGASSTLHRPSTRTRSG